MNEPPRVRTTAQPLSSLPEVGVWVVPVLPGTADEVLLGPGADDVEANRAVDLLAACAVSRLHGAAGEIGTAPTRDEGPAVLLVGVGHQSAAELRSAGAATARSARGKGSVATTAWAGDPGAVQAFVEGALLASFALTYRPDGPEKPAADPLVLAAFADDGTDDETALAVRRGGVDALAGWRARAIATTPARDKPPQWLADWAGKYADAAGLADVQVFAGQQLAALGCGAIIGVGQGSANTPRLVQLSYRPESSRRGGGRNRSAQSAHIVLVGKGITFDSGGLSLKPADAMMTMKRDVTGGAVVLAVMMALRDLRVGVRVTGLVAAAENAIGGAAQRPGDVVRHPNGRTTEVLNTDAEGRLVLADALAYAVNELEPTVLVDVATLTGAVKVALGTTLGGLYASDDALGDALVAAGNAAGEPLWRLPLVRDYADDLTSVVADSQNIGGASPVPARAGSITAALFLQAFTGGLPWAHLDLSSVGDASADAGVYTVGPTGFGARLLLAWLAGDNPLAGIDAHIPSGRS